MDKNKINRQIVSDPGKLIDLMSEMAPGRMASFCYVDFVDIYHYKHSLSKEDLKKLRHDVWNNCKFSTWAAELIAFSKLSSITVLPIGGIICVTRYHLNWGTETSYRRNAHKFMSAEDDIKRKYGLSINHGRPKQDIKTSYEVARGVTPNTQNRLYFHQNRKKILHKKRQYFVVGMTGRILGEIPEKAFEAIRVKEPVDAVVSEMNRLKFSQEKKDAYFKEINDLGFAHGKFLLDRLLFVVTTTKDGPIYFMNDAAKLYFYDIPINMEFFKKMANNIYQEEYQAIQQYNNQMDDTILENIVKKVSKRICENLYR